MSPHEFVSCHVRSRNNICLIGQHGVDDPLEQQKTSVFFYYPDGRANPWGAREIAETLSLYGCAVFEPDERHVFLTGDGLVYVIGKGDDDWEGKVAERIWFTNLVSVRRRHAYALASGPRVYRREAPGHWQSVSQGLPSWTDGFADLDGFADDDLYATASSRGLWHFDGASWSKLACPKLAMDSVCCGDDGVVYVLTSGGPIMCGRGDRWEVISHEHDWCEELVWFDGRTVVSTSDHLCEIVDGELRPFSPRAPFDPSYAKLSAADGILACATGKQAAFFDGDRWQQIR